MKVHVLEDRGWGYFLSGKSKINRLKNVFSPKKKRKFSEEPEAVASCTKSSPKEKKKSQKAQED